MKYFFLNLYNQKIKKIYLPIITLLCMMGASVSAQENTNNIILQANISYQDESGNEYQKQTEKIILEKSVLELVLTGGANLEISAGQPGQIAYQIENIGNEEAEYNFGGEVYNNSLPEGITKIILYKDSNENFAGEETEIVYKITPEHKELPTGSKRWFSLKPQQTDSFLLYIETSEEIEGVQTASLNISGQYSDRGPGAVYHFTTITNTLTLKGREKTYQGFDMVYGGETGEENKSLRNQPESIAHPFNPNNPEPATIIRFENQEEEKTVYLRLENHTSWQQNYTLKAEFAETELKDWHVLIIEKNNDTTVFDSQAEAEGKIFSVGGRAQEENGFLDFKIILKPPQTQSGKAWTFYENAASQIKITDSDDDLVFEQPILIKAKYQETSKTQTILLHMQQKNKIDSIELNSDMENESNMLPGMEKTIRYEIKNTGNTAHLLDLIYSRAGIDKDVITLMRAKQIEEDKKIVENFKPGESLTLTRIINLYPKDSENSVQNPQIGVFIKNRDEILAALDQNIKRVQPEVNIEQKAYTLENCINSEENKKLLYSLSKVKKDTCVLVEIILNNQTDHDYQPRQLFVSFPIPQNLDIIELPEGWQGNTTTLTYEIPSMNKGEQKNISALFMVK